MSRQVNEFDINLELFHDGLEFTTGKTLGVLDELILGNRELPTYKHKNFIVDTIADNPVTIITAETGTGKSTQLPQYLLETEDYDQILVTQPRRPAAKGVYSRIKEEIGEVLGPTVAEDCVAYHTAVEKMGPDNAPIKIVTDGLQLVEELHGKGVDGRKVLVIDEAHESNSNIELLLAWAKQKLQDDPLLRVVLMSAKMDTNTLADYFHDVTATRPPILEIKGRKHEVVEIERPDSTVSNVAMELLMTMQGKAGTVDEEGREGKTDKDGFDPETRGDTLIFLPGKREIQEVMDEVERRLPKGMHNKVKLFPLHGNLSPSEQDAALKEYPNHVKFVFSTDIAESSLTVPGLKYVVDAGLKRQPDVDYEGTKGLRTIPASRANCLQRMGRVGRTSDGIYILTRLNQDKPFVPLKNRDAYPIAEILRTDVQRSVLRLKDVGIEMRDWDMLNKASSRILELADVHLELLDATSESSGAMTPMGRAMNQYPLCTSSGRIMVEAAGYPRPIRSYLAAMTAAKEVGGLQFYGRSISSRWRELSDETQSDLLVQLDLFIASQNMTDAELKDYGFDVSNVHRAREQYVKIAKLAAASDDVLEVPTEEEREQILECSLVGFVPAIYSHQGGGQYLNISNNQAPTLREISNRSRVGSTPDYLVGDPWRVEVEKDGEVEELHIIHNATVVTEAQLGRLVAKHVVWKVTDYRVAGSNNVVLDKVQQIERAFAFGEFDLGQERQVAPEPSYALRSKIIEASLEVPGAEQRKLRDIKKQLEQLAHLTKRYVPQFTQEYLERLVHEAAPHDITNPATIEDNLRLMNLDPERALTLDTFIPSETVEEIRRSAPSEMIVGEQIRHVAYRKGKPLIRVHDPSFVLDVEEDHVFLDDGREVYFLYHNTAGRTRAFTLGQLKLAAMFELNA